MAQKSTAAAAVAVAVAVASFQMVGGKCLIPWRAPPCVGRGRRIYIYIYGNTMGVLWENGISLGTHHQLNPKFRGLREEKHKFSSRWTGDQRVSMAPDVAEQLIKDGYGVP